MEFEFDDLRFEKLITKHLRAMWRDPDELVIGENISDLPEIKIIFDGYGYNEDTDEQDNKNMESYAVFIHKGAINEGFEFPEHDMTPWALIHRPSEEVCVYVWYDVIQDEWEILPLEDRIEETKMTLEEVMNILENLDKTYWS